MVLDPDFLRRENFCDSHTFKADIGLLIFAWIFRTSWPKMEVLGEANWGKRWCNVDRSRNTTMRK